MSCAIGCVRILLFVFNFIFCLGGLALLIPGIIVESGIKSAEGFDADEIAQIEGAAIALIVIGSIIFIIAFFGCCGAIRESHCMVVTFAVLLLTLLVIQIGIAIYAFVTLNSVDNTTISDSFRKYVHEYWTSPGKRSTVDFSQDVFQCCGADSWKDYANVGNGTIPWSCCKQETDKHEFCNGKEVWNEGCGTVIPEKLRMAGKALGGVALGVGAVELIGIIFALCLANSIRNEDRRNYRV